MPEMVRRNIDRWAALNPDFEICIYNEGNIDVAASEFGKRALEAGKWAFLADVVRLQALIREGGVYLDSDIELLRPLSILEPWSEKLLLGYMYDCALGTAVMAAPPQHPYLMEVEKRYDGLLPGIWPVNNSIFTEYFINDVPGFLLNGKEWENEYCKLFRKEFFEQPAFCRRRGLAIHHCCGSWKTAASSFTFEGTVSPLAHMKKWASRQWRTWQSCRNNEFTATWRAACRGERLPYDASRYYLPR